MLVGINFSFRARSKITIGMAPVIFRKVAKKKKHCLRFFASKRTIEACAVFALQRDTSLSQVVPVVVHVVHVVLK